MVREKPSRRSFGVMVVLIYSLVSRCSGTAIRSNQSQAKSFPSLPHRHQQQHKLLVGLHAMCLCAVVIHEVFRYPGHLLGGDGRAKGAP